MKFNGNVQRTVFIQGLTSKIRIVIKSSIMSKFCSKHIKYYLNELLYTYYSIILQYNWSKAKENLTFSKLTKILTNSFKTLFFTEIYIGSTTILKVKIIFVSQHQLAYFLLVVSYFIIKIIVWYTLQT